MNSQPGGFITAVLMLVPLVGVPAAAILGIPPLPGTTSANADELEIIDDLDAIESSTSSGLMADASGWNQLDDLLSPVPSAPSITHQKAAVAPATQAPDVTDPFGSSEPLYSPFTDTTPDDDFTDTPGMDLASIDDLPTEPNRISLTSFDNTETPEPDWTNGDHHPATASNTASQTPQTWEQAVVELNRLNVRTYRLEEDTRRGGYHFYCVFSPQNQPNIRHRFDGTASQPLAAVIDVLNQIELWRNAR